jgi:SulP family sulfate permease
LVFGQTWQLGTILVISAIALLFNAGGLELVVRRDIDLNHELRSTGLANILSGLSGGPIGYLTLSLSALGHKMGSTSRLAGLFSAALCGVVLCFGVSLLSFLPRPVLGGLLFFLGLSFLVEWMYDAWFKIPRADWLIILLILFVISTRGFLDGVATGLLIAVVLFVIKYSGVDVVKQTLSGANSTSNVDRPVEHRRLLRETGEKLSILRLQGYIFFGTAHNLYRTISQRAEASGLPCLRFVLLDFTRVTGLDSSAAICFSKIIQLAQSSDFCVIFTNMTPELEHQLNKTVFSEDNESVYRIFPDQDYGIEWCENEILAAENVLQAEGEQPLFAYLEESFPKSVDVGRFLAYLEKKEVGEGYYLMHEAEASEDLYFIESGQVNALISTSRGGDKTVRSGSEERNTLRLRAMRPGTVVGEVSMYLGTSRTASAVTTKPSTLYRLSSEALRQMEKREPELASAFHQFVARLLAERISDNVRTIQPLTD